MISEKLFKKRILEIAEFDDETISLMPESYQAFIQLVKKTIREKEIKE